VAQLKLNLGREVELRVFNGDCAKVLPELEANLIQCCVTSPPYWGLRDYDHPNNTRGQSPGMYACFVMDLLAECHEHRVAS
jgi:DNA modification methylase